MNFFQCRNILPSHLSVWLYEHEMLYSHVLSSHIFSAQLTLHSFSIIKRYCLTLERPQQKQQQQQQQQNNNKTIQYLTGVF